MMWRRSTGAICLSKIAPKLSRYFESARRLGHRASKLPPAFSFEGCKAMSLRATSAR